MGFWEIKTLPDLWTVGRDFTSKLMKLTVFCDNRRDPRNVSTDSELDKVG